MAGPIAACKVCSRETQVHRDSTGLNASLGDRGETAVLRSWREVKVTGFSVRS